METEIIEQLVGTLRSEGLDFETSPFYPYQEEALQPVSDIELDHGSKLALPGPCRTTGAVGVYRLTKAREFMDHRKTCWRNL